MYLLVEFRKILANESCRTDSSDVLVCSHGQLGQLLGKRKIIVIRV